ncbi:unnamed protein product [Musa acuminata subsp. malaccensis]|uniref:(wild Malaysian banana) hypothetical protein n=1 Tax=Musa acuminata subsp. malaccensis TaxID=214687 RepID=A0A804HPN0_MUSAM|nr:unnamed protein product [Musa acuminata subsp. malaccensis]
MKRTLTNRVAREPNQLPGVLEFGGGLLLEPRTTVPVPRTATAASCPCGWPRGSARPGRGRHR